MEIQQMGKPLKEGSKYQQRGFWSKKLPAVEDRCLQQHNSDHDNLIYQQTQSL